MPVCAARPLSPQFRRKAGTSRHIQTFKRCVEEFRRISVEYLKSEVRPWDSDVRRKIGQKYHSCGAKITCAASKLTCVVLISSVREEFYHWNFSKCNMYVRIINVQTGTHRWAENCEISLDKARGMDAEPYSTVDALSQAHKLTGYLYEH